MNVQSINPYKELWVAVLFQAIKDYIKGNDLQHREARGWIMRDDPDTFNSFIHICRILGTDPGQIRERILSADSDLAKRFIAVLLKYYPDKRALWEERISN